MASTTAVLAALPPVIPAPLPARLFPTLTAREEGYRFVKSVEKFEKKTEFKSPDASIYREVYTYGKKKKPGVLWFNVRSKLKIENASRQNAFSIAAAEICNFGFGATKYRILKDGDSSTLLSKAVCEYLEFYDFENKHDFIGKEIARFYDSAYFIQDCGRVVLSLAVWEQNDLNEGNIGLQKTGSESHMTAIDPVMCFWSLTAKFTPPLMVKKTKEINRYIDYQANVVSLPNESFSSMGKFTSDVYNNLPRDSDVFFPQNWCFRQLPFYSSELSVNPLFLAEKHLQTLKDLVSRVIYLEMAEIHIGHEQDCLDLKSLINRTLDNLLQEALKTSFLDFLKKEGQIAIKVILYEIKDFLLKNKHYRYSDEEKAAAQGAAICDVILKEFNIVKAKGAFPLLADDERELRRFAKSIFQERKVLDYKQDLSDVQLYYMQYGMFNRADGVDSLIREISIKDAAATALAPGPAIPPAAAIFRI